MNSIFIKKEEHLLLLPDVITSSPTILAGFTTRFGGFSSSPFESNNLGLHVNDKTSDVISNRSKLADSIQFPLHRWVSAEQTHEDQLVKVTSQMAGLGSQRYEDSIKGTDGFYTRENNLLLTMVYADCVPLYFFAPSHNLIGIAHAGWKGSVKSIAGKMVQLWNDTEDVPPDDVRVVIGPSIHSCCYVVDSKVITPIDDLWNSLNLNRNDLPYIKTSEDNQFRLDLPSLNKMLLLHYGIPEDQIFLSSDCTSCNADYFSHRRDKGKTGRMMAFIGHA